MTIAGNLRTMSFPDILQWLATGGHTGTLVVTNGTIEKSVFFKGGAIMSCTSSDPKEFLGHHLVSQGFINEGQLAAAVAEQERSRELLGKILVDQGAITAEALDRSLKTKAEESIYGLFRWTEGEFSFVDNVLPEYEMVPVSLNVTSLVFEGVRRIDEWNRILDIVPSAECVPVTVGDVMEGEEDDSRSKVLSLVDDDRSIEDICLQTHSVEFFVFEILAEKVREGKMKIVRPRIHKVVEMPSSMSATSLITEGRQLLAAGEFERAVRHLRAAANLDADSRDTKEAIRWAEIEIRANLESEGVDLAAVPVMKRPLDQVKSINVSPEEGFILSRIDGRMDLKSILKISPLPELDALLVMWNLVKSGHIKLEIR